MLLRGRLGGSDVLRADAEGCVRGRRGVRRSWAGQVCGRALQLLAGVFWREMRRVCGPVGGRAVRDGMLGDGDLLWTRTVRGGWGRLADMRVRGRLGWGLMQLAERDGLCQRLDMRGGGGARAVRGREVPVL